MEIIKHRANSYLQIEPNMGFEIDIRDYKNKLVLSHDHPNENDITLENFLEHLPKNALLAINIKSSEIECDLKSILEKYNISNYFTFDWPIPSLLKALDIDLVCAFRLSEYEKNIIPRCKWVWLDSFHSIWYDKEFLLSLKTQGLKIAIVSPELHNRKSDLKKTKELINEIQVDAICTDLPEFWI